MSQKPLLDLYTRFLAFFSIPNFTKRINVLIMYSRCDLSTDFLGFWEICNYREDHLIFRRRKGHGGGGGAVLS